MSIQKLNPIVMIAPYLPESVPGNGSLAAAHKIESVVRILARTGRRIIFINSAHIKNEFKAPSASLETIGGVRVLQVTPFTLKCRPGGKFLNILAARAIASRIAQLNPSLVWIYNSYAFEARAALRISKQTKCEIVLELEDLPQARGRGWLSIKPLLDAFYFQLLKRKAALITCVNSSIQANINSANTLMLPYIMSPSVGVDGKKPFEAAKYTVGYFGGLTQEKGAASLPKFCDALPTDWKMVVTGRGNLAPALHEYSSNSSGKMQFFENVPDAKLYELLNQCDLVVNPHTSIESMGQGVFPFKVLEAVASGRLVMSTDLPPCSFDLSASVINFDGTVEGFSQALNRAQHFFHSNHSSFIATVASIRTVLSEESIYGTLKDLDILS